MELISSVSNTGRKLPTRTDYLARFWSTGPGCRVLQTRVVSPRETTSETESDFSDLFVPLRSECNCARTRGYLRPCWANRTRVAAFDTSGLIPGDQQRLGNGPMRELLFATVVVQIFVRGHPKVITLSAVPCCWCDRGVTPLLIIANVC